MKKVCIFVVLVVAVFSLQAQTPLEMMQLKAKSKNPIFSQIGQASTTPAFEMKGYWTWGSSVVKGEDRMYHMFVSVFPKSLPFHPGWMVASKVVHAVSERLEGPYAYVADALPERGAEYWDGRSTHNPRILVYKGMYYLIYMGSTHPFEAPTFDALTLDSKWCVVGRSNKRIGLAVSDSPYGPWKRFDKPILEPVPGTFYSYLTSNPSPIIQEDGSVMMIFKGRAYEGIGYSDMALGVAYAPTIEGPYRVLNDNKPIFDIRRDGEIEDPFLWKDKAGYHIIFKDHRAQFAGEKGGGVLAHSSDAVNWKVDKDPKAYSKVIEYADGKIVRQGQLERPFIYMENGVMKALFFATMDGPGEFENGTRSWNMSIPFKTSK